MSALALSPSYQAELTGSLSLHHCEMSALALSPSYQAELTGSLSLHHCEMTSRKSDRFPAVIVCSNLAFLGSGGYWSNSHYEVTGLEPVQFLCDLF